MTEGHTWGGDHDLSAWETIMWRLENDPRTRATSIIAEMLDTEPEWDRFLSAHERGSRKVPRLRERIVMPSLPVGLPAWSEDRHFDIEHHVYRVRLPEPGTQEQLQEVLESIMNRPLDRARPPWEVVLITGLQGGRAAYALKTHHALSDGVGLVHLMEVGHSRTREPGARQVPEAPERPTYSPPSLMVRRLRDTMVEAPKEVMRATSGASKLLGRRSLHPIRAFPDAVAWINAAKRNLLPPPVERSTLLHTTGGAGCRILLYDVPLAGLRTAGKTAGGTLNDAYLTGMLGALRVYHERHGVTGPPVLPVTMPISTRWVGAEAGGNHFTASRLMLPMAERDPAARLREVRARVLAARQDPSLGLIEQLARGALLLPDKMLADTMASHAGSADLQISNLPGVRHETYIAGAKVTGTYPIGPRPAVAAMVAIMSYEDTACLAFNLDAKVFTDLAELRDCLDVGFGEVLAMGEQGETAAARNGGIGTETERA